jgi:hypothetical protein
MRHERLIDDAAWLIATSLVETMSPRLRVDERQEALVVFYTTIRAGIDAYQDLLERMQNRLGPAEKTAGPA